MFGDFFLRHKLQSLGVYNIRSQLAHHSVLWARLGGDGSFPQQEADGSSPRVPPTGSSAGAGHPRRLHPMWAARPPGLPGLSRTLLIFSAGSWASTW